jgi:hydroxyethylthiazole kinase/thiamine-phosphate diphosphorylase
MLAVVRRATVRPKRCAGRHIWARLQNNAADARFRLYLVTDDKYHDQDLVEKIRGAVRGGVSCVQVRLKKATTMEYVGLVKQVKAALEKDGAGHVPVMVDDRLDVALAAGADGLHVGDGDLEAKLARKFLPDHMILGVSLYGDLDRARALIEESKQEGFTVDYVAGAGVASSTTKAFEPKGHESYDAFKKGLMSAGFNSPVIAIGGLDANNTEDVVYSGADGVCFVSGLLGLPTDQVEAKARYLLDLQQRGSRDKSAMKTFDIESGREPLALALQGVRTHRPLVHCMTNYVSMDICANLLLAASCSPAMVHAEQEAPQFASICAENIANGAVCINVGTLSTHWARAMEATAAQCAESNIPWILDPVAVGVPALQFRTDVCVRLVQHKPTVIRGNPAECIALAQAVLPQDVVTQLEASKVSSFDALEQSGADSRSDSTQVDLRYVDALASHTGGVVVTTGSVDYVSCGRTGRRFLVKHDVPQLQFVTAAGCALSALIGGFLAAAPRLQNGEKDFALASAHAVAYYTVAAQKACENDGQEGMGPGSVRTALLDKLYAISPQELVACAKIEALGVDVDK